jgi:hypothetical protein
MLWYNSKWTINLTDKIEPNCQRKNHSDNVYAKVHKNAYCHSVVSLALNTFAVTTKILQQKTERIRTEPLLIRIRDGIFDEEYYIAAAFGEFVISRRTSLPR